MRKKLRFIFAMISCMIVLTAYAAAADGMLKVGLYYGNNALSSANLQNEVGSGYLLGWYDETTRDFSSVGYLEDNKIMRKRQS